MLIPANLVLKPLGAAGTPAQIVGLAAAAWWLAVQLSRSRATLRPAQPVRTAMALFVVAMMAAYVAGTTRPIDGLEVSSADRGLLLVLSWWGLVMLAGDGFASRDRLDRVLRALVTTAGFAGALGILQFFTGRAFVDLISIPGLSSNTTLNSVYARNGFARAAGMSTHPIEFGVLMIMVLPIALHFALQPSDRSRLARWWPVVAIGGAVPITMSRSALLGLVVVLAALLPSWPVRRRWFTLVTVVAGFGVVYVAIPGLLGTMIRLFTGISEDDSAKSRTDSYDLAWQFISQHPWFGRGPSTFLPSYRILDNQYLGLTIEAGIFGVGAFVVLLGTALLVAYRLSKRLALADDRSLARALFACVAAAALAFVTFDAFGFPQVAGVLFFALGCVSALRRLTLTRDATSLPAAASAAAPGAAADTAPIAAGGAR